MRVMLEARIGATKAHRPSEQAKIVAGLVRLSGTDVDAAVARTDDNDDELGLVFIWTPRAERWRTRRDLDPNVVEGLIEWRRIRDERRGASSEFGHDFYEDE